MASDFKQLLFHVLWIGGGTDSGKSTISQLLADRYDWQRYDYDGRDVFHHDCLAHTMPEIQAFLEATDYERWVRPSPEALMARSFHSFRLRFPLVLADLTAMPDDKQIVAEGFGLTPELIAPLLSNPRQAIFFAPTDAFKWESMKKRGKYFRRLAWENGEQAIKNLFERDRMITTEIRQQAQARGLRVHEVDGSLTLEETADLVAQHFAPYMDLDKRYE